MCAVAKDTPTTGSCLVEAVVDSGAEESLAPPNAFAGEIHASAMSKAGVKHKAANVTRIPNLGQEKVRFRSDEGHLCSVGQVASQVAAAGNRVTFMAQGGEIENIKT